MITVWEGTFTVEGKEYEVVITVDPERLAKSLRGAPLRAVAEKAWATGGHTATRCRGAIRFEFSWD